MKDNKIKSIFIMLLFIITIFYIVKIYNSKYINNNIIFKQLQDNNIINSANNNIDNDINLGYINKKLNNNNIKTLQGKCDINIYTQSTLYVDLNDKLKSIINQLINEYTSMDYNDYTIFNIKYVKEQIDSNNNKRYLITLFINYNESFINDKIFIDFILYNNGSIHLNKLSNDINSYNTLINNIKPIDNINLNNFGILDENNINKGKKYVDTLNTNMYKSYENDLDKYLGTYSKYNNSDFCNKYYHKQWDQYGVKLPTNINDECIFNNKAYGNRWDYPNNQQFIFEKKTDNDKYTWLMGSDNIYSDYTNELHVTS